MSRPIPNGSLRRERKRRGDRGRTGQTAGPRAHDDHPSVDCSGAPAVLASGQPGIDRRAILSHLAPSDQAVQTADGRPVGRRPVPRLLLAIVVAALAATAVAITASAPATSDPVIAAAGDIACDPTDGSFNGGQGTAGSCRESATSDLLVNGGFTAVLPLGDDQYNCGGLAAFQQSYDPTWGRVKPATHPVIGNHEYDTSGGTDCDPTGNAGGYWGYYGAAAGDTGKGYYSYDIGSWHIIALNSNVGCAKVACSAGSTQEQWLKADLAAHPAACTLAYWHAPRFSSSISSPASAYLPFWQDLYAAGADVILNGHIHNYERFAPQDPSGNLDNAAGIREFIVGTGGKGLQLFSTVAANSEV